MRQNVYDYGKKEIKEILLYYREGFTIKEITELTNLTYYEVIYILKKTLSDLDIPTNYLYDEISDQKVLIVSDTHIGSYKENLDYIREAYHYAKSLGIKTALHGGDLIQSTFSNVNKKYFNEDKQIEHLLAVYPTGLDNYILLGNHDYNTLKKDNHYSIDIESRDDFHLMGFKRAYLSWQGHPISLYHTCKKYRLPIESLDTILNLRGHSHHLTYNKSNTVNIPTLSDDMFEHNYGRPGFLIGTLHDDNLSLESLYFTNDSLHREGKILTKKLK